MPKRTDVSKVLILAAALLMSGRALGQQNKSPEADSDERWHTVARICGKVAYVHRKQSKDGSWRETFKGIHKARLRLFRREPGVDCCNADALVGETVSGPLSGFGFKVKDGTYWLLATVGAAEYRMPVRQDKKVGGDDFLCTDNYFAITEDGKFQLTGTVRVD